MRHVHRKVNPLNNVDSVIRATGIRKQFGEFEVVRGIDLDVAQGQCFGLLGPNGAGKTTTIKLILGQSPLTAGELKVFGQPMPEAARQVRTRIGVVPQSDNLDPDFTVAENLQVYASYFSVPSRLIAQRMDYLLNFVQLIDRADARIDTLSGGMKRRLTIARALVNEPELIVLDEPTTGLDPQVRHLIWARLRELKQSGKTLLLTSHYMEEAERLCDDLVIIDEGRILAQGPPRKLIETHVEPEVLELRGDMPNILAVLDGLQECRIETVGDTTYCYARDIKPLAQRLENHPELSFLHRPATLEDVFLRITGRDLRE